MQGPPLNPDCADVSPAEPGLTGYDEEHAVTYVRMLDAHEEGADWRDVARIVLRSRGRYIRNRESDSLTSVLCNCTKLHREPVANLGGA
jgi:hypothetical protein